MSGERDLDVDRMVEFFGGNRAAAIAFLRETIPDVTALVHAVLRARSLSEREGAAHDLHGTAANLGAPRLARAAATLGARCRNGQPAGTAERAMCIALLAFTTAVDALSGETNDAAP